jgi:hypothetical protein
MKKTVAIYHRSVPNAKNQEKIDLLKYFSEGVVTAGDTAIDVQTNTYQASDVGVIQGWISQTTTRPHLSLRNQVIQEQIKSDRFVIAVDSNLFLYANTANTLHYLRYSFNGVFPLTGIYCDTKIDPSRWQNLSQNLNLSLKDYRTTGNHILICLQRDLGWSMGGISVPEWANQTIAKIRQYTDRPIIIRAHPGDKNSSNYLNQIMWSHSIQLSTNKKLIDDLQNCWAVVNHNSSPAVGAAIEGVPVFVTDPAKSQCREIANIDLAQIENPLMLDRQQWVERLSMFHWNFDELRSSKCWRHMREFI